MSRCYSAAIVRFFFELSPVRLAFFLTLVTVIGAGDPGTDVSSTIALVLDAPQTGTSAPPLGGVAELRADFAASGISPTRSTTYDCGVVDRGVLRKLGKRELTEHNIYQPKELSCLGQFGSPDD